MALETLHPDVFVEEAQGVPRVVGVSVSTAGLLGRTKKGPTDRATLVTSFTQFKERYGPYYQGTAFSYMPWATEGYFEEGGRRAWIARAIGAGAAKSSGALPAYGLGAVAGTVLSGNQQLFNLEPGQTIVYSENGGGDQTATFAATQAVRAGAGEAFATIVGGETLQLRIDGGDLQTVAFQAADTTAAAVAARINSELFGGSAVVNGAEVDIRSDRRGSTSSVEIVGGTSLAKIGHAVGTTLGTGNVGDIDAVTAAEAVTVLNAAFAGSPASEEGGRVRLTSATTGPASSVQVKVTSTAAGFGFDNLVHSGSASAVVDSLMVRAQNEGAWGNDLRIATTRWSTNTSALLANGGVSVALDSVRNIERGDVVLIESPDGLNSAAVHVVAINPSTKVISFRPCSLVAPLTPLPVDSVARSSTMHRRVTELAAAVLSTDTDLPLRNAQGIVEGAHITVDDGVNFEEGVVAAVNGNTVRLTAAIGTAFAANTMVATQEFMLQVFEEGVLKETHTFLSLEPGNVQDYIGNRLAGDGNESLYRIVVEDLLTSPSPLVNRAPRPQSKTLSGGLDGAALTADDLIGSSPSGMHLFDVIENINRFAAPGVTDPAFILAAIAYAEGQTHKGALTFYCEAPLEDDQPEEALDYRNFELNADSSHAALYYPWLVQRDPFNAKGRLSIPPTGRVLGRVADVVASRGVHVAPANVTLRNVLGLTHDTTDGEQDILNPAGVNVIRSFPGQGIRIWGARTLASLKDGRHYVNVREELNFIKLSIATGMRFTVFEPNDPRLWRTIERTVGGFLSGMWLQGQLFPSDDEARAWFVKCDAETNTLQTIAEGKVIAEVGVNPPLPAEFCVFSIGVWDGGTSIEEEIQRRG